MDLKIITLNKSGQTQSTDCGFMSIKFWKIQTNLEWPRVTQWLPGDGSGREGPVGCTGHETGISGLGGDRNVSILITAIA